MGWKYWLVDIPAAIVTLWLRAYWVILALATVALVVTACLSLALAAVGIRWGW